MKRGTGVLILLITVATKAQVPGSLDPGFGNGGIAYIEPGAVAGVIDVAEDVTGRIVSVLSSSNFSYDRVLQRHSASGVLDLSFGTAGSFALPDTLRPKLIALQPDGRIVIAGNIGNAHDPAFVARVLPNGGMDLSFSSDGVATFNFFNQINLFKDMEIALDGAILLGGYGYNDIGPRLGLIVRLLSDGALDPSFGTGGITTFNILTETEVSGIEILGSGAVAFGGHAWTDFNTASDFMVGRLLPDGAVDASYGTAGFTLLPYSTNGTGTDQYSSIAAWPDGSVAIAGVTELALGNIWMSGLVIAKLDAYGTLDPEFGNGGWHLFDLDSVAISSTQIEAWSDSSLLIVARYADDGFLNWTAHSTLIHVGPSGVPDGSFGIDGVLDLEFVGAVQQDLRSMLITADQGILLGGSRYEEDPGPNEALLVKLHGPAVGITEGQLSNASVVFGGLLTPSDNLLRIIDWLGEPCHLNLLDLHGRPVAVLYNGCVGQDGLVRFDIPQALSHGSYVLEAIAGCRRFALPCVY